MTGRIGDIHKGCRTFLGLSNDLLATIFLYLTALRSDTTYPQNADVLCESCQQTILTFGNGCFKTVFVILIKILNKRESQSNRHSKQFSLRFGTLFADTNTIGTCNKNKTPFTTLQFRTLIATFFPNVKFTRISKLNGNDVKNRWKRHES